MNEIKDWPPNIQALRLIFPVDDPKFNPLFPYGKVLYNPRGMEIPPDILYHEQIHSEQQGGNPEWWWQTYMLQCDFRLKQEVEAYARQLNFVKTVYPDKKAKMCLDELAENLSSELYKLNITKYQATTFIRLKSKAMKQVMANSED